MEADNTRDKRPRKNFSDEVMEISCRARSLDTLEIADASWPQEPASAFYWKVLATIDALAQILAGFEMRNVLAGQGHGLAGLGITSDPGRPEVQRKTAEAPDLDALPLRQRIAHQVQQVLDRKFDVFGGQVLLLSGDRFYEFRFGHFSGFFCL